MKPFSVHGLKMKLGETLQPAIKHTGQKEHTGDTAVQDILHKKLSS